MAASESVWVECPQCGDESRDHAVLQEHKREITDEDGMRGTVTLFQVVQCKGCKAIRFRQDEVELDSYDQRDDEYFHTVKVYPEPPKAMPRIPAEITNREIRRDYTEALEIRHASARASAAMGRRVLQLMLREQGFVHPSRKLFKEIGEAAKDTRTSASLAEKLTFIRDVGNDAAHPNEDHEGAIVEVTDEDLELLFAALEEFSDVYYVKPIRHRKLMEARKSRIEGPKAATPTSTSTAPPK